MASPPLFYDLEFVAPDPKYRCTSCRMYLRDPMQTVCGHRICRTCFEENLSRSGPEGFMCLAQEDDCEVINAQKANPDLSFTREMGLQFVYCFNRKNGCKEIVELKKINDHSLECQFTATSCRGVVCEFNLIGCTFRGSEVEVENHKLNASQDHLELVMAHAMQLKHEYSNLKEILEKTFGEKERLEMKLTNLETEIRSLEIIQKNIIYQAKQSQQTQLMALANCGEKALKMEEKMKSFDSIGQEVLLADSRLSQIEQRVNSGGLSEPLRERIIAHDTAINRHTCLISEVNLKFNCLETSSYDGTLIWKICEYRKYLNDAVSGVTPSLYSQPFYTSQYGYKLCARVFLNGDGEGEGTHISFFIVVMQGDYDDIIQWPFEQKVTLALLDQSTNRHHIIYAFRTNSSNSSNASFAKPASPMNIASGVQLFVPHSQLEINDTYLKNDTLFFKIIVEA